MTQSRRIAGKFTCCFSWIKFLTSKTFQLCRLPSAIERKCDCGSLVGYQIGLDKKMDSNVNSDTRILYCTTSRNLWLTNPCDSHVSSTSVVCEGTCISLGNTKLSQDPHSRKLKFHFSHPQIIFDEVHERDISATLNSDKIANFWGDREKKWSDEQSLALKNLREIHEHVKDIKNRLNQLRIDVNDKVFEYKDEEKLFVIKLCIAGAFYANYFTAEPWRLQGLEEHESMHKGMESNRLERLRETTSNETRGCLCRRRHPRPACEVR